MIQIDLGGETEIKKVCYAKGGHVSVFLKNGIHLKTTIDKISDEVLAACEKFTAGITNHLVTNAGGVVNEDEIISDIETEKEELINSKLVEEEV